jgi:hypothetical protein
MRKVQKLKRTMRKSQKKIKGRKGSKGGKRKTQVRRTKKATLKRRKRKKKTMKGGAIPFSEITSAYGRTIDSVNQALLPVTGDNTPESAVVSSDPTRGHFANSTSFVSDSDVGPDLAGAYRDAYE